LTFEELDLFRTNAPATVCGEWSAGCKIHKREEDDAEEEKQADCLDESAEDVGEH